MELFLKITLIIHVLAGMNSLVSGFIAIVTKKGQLIHKRAGRIYFYGMIIAAVTALFISIVKGLDFFIMIAIFSFYLSYTGYRFVLLKQQKLKWFDIIVIAVNLVVNIYMLFQGNVILLVFAIIGILNSVGDLRFNFFPKTPSSKLVWLYNHLGKMIGSYIATVTAFLVNNMHIGPMLVWWLGPTFIGVFVIAYFTKLYKQKDPFYRNKKLEAEGIKN